MLNSCAQVILLDPQPPESPSFTKKKKKSITTTKPEE
jgi:hypothetical protein